MTTSDTVPWTVYCWCQCVTTHITRSVQWPHWIPSCQF